jgi:predicted RND superfamily exporter protein
MGARSGIRERIGVAFERWGSAVVRRRWWTIACVLSLTGAVGSQLTRIEVDNSVEAFLRQDDPNLIHYNELRDQMGGSGIPLDMSTTLLGGIVIGLAVDDTIHFMHRFNRYYDQTGDSERAVRETLETTGTAMLLTSVVLGAGFLVFTLAYMQNIAAFGVLCAFATAAAFLADVTLAPALMALVTRPGAVRN